MLSAGGTGGHVLPAILVAKEIQKTSPNQRVIILGVGTPIEKKLLADTSFEHIILDSRGIVGKGLISKVSALYSHIKNFKTLKNILRNNSVSAVLGFGGYPSFMPLLAARTMGLKTFLFEQNGKAGLANKLASLFVRKCYSVPYAEGLLSSKITYIFNPVREEIRNLDKTQNFLSTVEGKEKNLNILILGGSQGAVSMNTLVSETLISLNRSDISVVHQTGERDIGRMKTTYKGIASKVDCVSFIEDMAGEYQKADLIISRAGAGTYGEILAVEKPCIFIPLIISRGHQYYNVSHLSMAGGALVLDQSRGEESSQQLIDLIVKSLEDSEYLKSIRTNLIAFKEKTKGEAGEKVLSQMLLQEIG